MSKILNLNSFRKKQKEVRKLKNKLKNLSKSVYFKKAAVAFIVVTIIFSSGSYIFKSRNAKAASYTFYQNDWTGGADGGTIPDHENNQSNWDQYSSKDASVRAGSWEVTLDKEENSNTQTSDADFNAGTFTSNTKTDGNKVTLNNANPGSIHTEDWDGDKHNIVTSGDGSSILLTGSNPVPTTLFYDGDSISLGYDKITFDPVTESLWVTNLTNDIDKVIKINPITDTRTDFILGPYTHPYSVYDSAYGTTYINPQYIIFDPASESVWTANDGFSFSKINIHSGESSQLIIGEEASHNLFSPDSLAFDNTSGKIFASGQHDISASPSNLHTLVQFDHSATGALSSSAADSEIESVYRLAFDSSGNLWKTNPASDTVSKITNPSTYPVSSEVNEYSVGDNPYEITFDSVTGSMWVVNNGSGTVSKVNISTGEKTDYDSGRGTGSNTGLGEIIFDPVTESVWITGYNGVSQIDIYTGELNYYDTWDPTAGSGDSSPAPQGITFDSTTNSVWVTLGSGKLNRYSLYAGQYYDRLDSGEAESYAWDGKTFSWDQTANGGSVYMKVKTSDIGTGWPDFSSGTCDTSSSGATGSITLTADCSSATDRYLWYEATFFPPLGTDPQDGLAQPPSLDQVQTNGGASVGTFTSSVMDLIDAYPLTTLEYTKTTPSGSAVTIDMRAGNTGAPDETWTEWQTNISNEGDISGLSGNRYIQYRANLSTNDAAVNPSLDDISINYESYPDSPQALVSSIYNTTFDSAKLQKIEWYEYLPDANTDIQVQLRTSPNGTSNWTDWAGPDGTSSSYFTDPNGEETMPSIFTSGNNDQYFQYKLFISSTNPNYAPTLEYMLITYSDSYFSFYQSYWADGLDGGANPNHTNNQTDWGQYSSKDSNINTDWSASLTPEVNAIIHTLDEHFNAGTYTSNTKTLDDNLMLTATENTSSPSKTNSWNGTKSNTVASGDGTSVLLSGSNINNYSTGYGPRSVAFDSATNSIWTTNYNTNTVSKINVNTGAITASYSVPGSYGPWDVAFDSYTNSVWVTNYGKNTVSKINVTDGTRSDYSTGSSPRGVVFDSATNSIWVANYGSGNVNKINVETGAIVGTYSIGSSPQGIAFDSYTNSVWVANYSSNTVSKVDVVSGSVTNYSVGSGPWDVAFDSVTNSVWVTNSFSNTVSKVNVTDGTRTNYSVGYLPNGVAFDSATNSVWVANANSNTASQVNINTGAVTSTTTVGSYPIGVAFDSATNSVWVANYNSASVSKISSSTIYKSSGTYTDKLDAGSAESYIWDGKTFSWDQTANEGSISIKVKTSSNGTTAPSFSSGTCDGSSSGATGSINLTAACSSSTDRYLWFQVTFTPKADLTQSPSLDQVQTTGGAALYNTSGLFTSSIIDLDGEFPLDTLIFNTTIPSGTTLTVDVRAGNTATPDGTWTSWQTNMQSGDDISSFVGNRYVQYQVNFSTTNTLLSPVLHDIGFYLNDPNYLSSGTLTSSSYDSEFTNNRLKSIQWSGEFSETAEIKFQLRTSPDNETWTDWVGPDGTSSSYFTDNTGGENMPSIFTSGSNDRYFQYKAFFSTTDSNQAPTLYDVTVTYGENSEILAPTISGCENGHLYFDDITPIIENGTATLNGNAFTSGTTITEEGTHTIVADNGSGTIASSTCSILKNKTVTDPDSTKINEDYTLGIIETEDLATASSQAEINVNYTLISNNSSIYIPRNTVITPTQGGTMDITALTASNISQIISQENSNSKGAIEVGIPSQGLTFSQAVTITLAVEPSYNGKPLTIYTRSGSGEEWAYHSTCTVSDSKCVFSTTHATQYMGYFEVSNSPTPTDVNVGIDAIISLTCTDSITMGTITGTGQSNLTTNEALCTVSTNNSTGYALYWQASTAYLENGTGDQITAYTPTTPDTPENWEVSATESEWGAKLKSGSTTYNSSTWGDDDTYSNGNWLNISAVSPYQIITRTTETSQAGDSETLLFGAEIGSNKFQPTGTYDVDVTVTATTL